jgi:hypothetical protein
MKNSMEFAEPLKRFVIRIVKLTAKQRQCKKCRTGMKSSSKKRYRSMTALEANLRLQDILERTAVYDMSLMPEEQNKAYQERLWQNRMMLEKKKAALLQQATK